jgi:DNA-binding beta-propeller fold protein YncE
MRATATRGRRIWPRAVRGALRAVLLGALLVLLGACGNSGSGAAAGSATNSKPSGPQSRTVTVGVNPQNSVLDQATQTLYVVSDPEDSTHGMVTVLSASTCNRLRASGCVSTTPSVPVGDGPVAIAVDQVTDTIYVVNSGSSTVSVINGATCNARNTSGCSRQPPAVTVGNGPVDVAVNQETDTVYVANWGNGTGTTVSVINGRSCNGQVTSGCGRPRAAVTIGTGPAGVAVDQSTDTVYAGTVTADGAESVSVINGATCNGATTSGCRRRPPSVLAGTGSVNYNVAFALDQATHTLYVANWAGNTLSMIDTATCSGAVTSGCAQAPPTARVGRGPDGLALDLATHTVYVADVTDNTISVVDAATCNATVRSGCGTAPFRSIRTGRSPRWVTVDQVTDTLYVTNGDEYTASVLNGASCNATVASGCI